MFLRILVPERLVVAGDRVKKVRTVQVLGYYHLVECYIVEILVPFNAARMGFEQRSLSGQ